MNRYMYASVNFFDYEMKQYEIEVSTALEALEYGFSRIDDMELRDDLYEGCVTEQEKISALKQEGFNVDMCIGVKLIDG